MSKKKRFGISPALDRGLSETIHVVENHSGVFRNIHLPLSRIELDPDNPRKLLIGINEVRSGILPQDPQFAVKSAELEKLKELAHTIKKSGIINPIVVYKRGSEFYRIVAGERRCLASIIAGKQEIEARVFNEKPKEFDLKLIQWVENTARQDLTLEERLANIEDILKSYQLENGPVEMNATLLKNITGLSLSQMTSYMNVLKSTKEVREHIKSGHINSLDKAAFIASITVNSLREQAILACQQGASLKDLKMLVNQQKILNKQKSLPVSSRGRLTAKINLGHTAQGETVRIIIDAVLTKKPYQTYASFFSDINWQDLKQATKAFRQLIDIIEGKAQ